MPARHTAFVAILAWVIVVGHGRASDCTRTSIGVMPLDDLGAGLYLGSFEGGLYSGGLNEPPAAHALAGVRRANHVEPLDLAGNPSPAGNYVLLSIGMSNTTQEFCSQGSAEPCDAWTFMGQAAVHPHVDRTHLVIINGARGGQAAANWDSPNEANYDRVRDVVLAPRGLTEAQVQVVWVKQANPQPTVHLPQANADAYVLERRLGDIARAIRVRYPNVKLVFLSSRIYAGYAFGTSALNPEPYAYEGGFSVKWLIEAQVNQMAGGGVDGHAGDLDYDTVAPWVGWGPYLWADGLTPGSDGLVWTCSDLQSDGTHPAMTGEEKVGTMLLEFMLTSPFAVRWFRAGPASDFDLDEDVDAADFDHFLTCATGPGIVQTIAVCLNADLDGDTDVDQADYGVFQACLSGEDPADP